MKTAGQKDASSELVTPFSAGRCDEFSFSQVNGLDCSLDLWHEDISCNAVSSQLTSLRWSAARGWTGLGLFTHLSFVFFLSVTALHGAGGGQEGLKCRYGTSAQKLV